MLCCEARHFLLRWICISALLVHCSPLIASSPADQQHARGESTIFKQLPFFIKFAFLSFIIPLPEEELRGTHHSLLDTFLPSPEAFPVEDAHAREKLRSLREDMWQTFQSNGDLGRVLSLFGRLTLLRDFALRMGNDTKSDPLPELLAGFLAEKKKSFSDLTLQERRAVFSLLTKHRATPVRKIGAFVRLVYNSALYRSALAENIVDTTLPPLHSPDIDARANTLRESLAASPLRVEHGRITHKDGAFDVAVIGSGPSGSVLASQFHLAGYRVILIERGSMPVPYAADVTRMSEFFGGGGVYPSQEDTVMLLTGEAAGGGTSVNADLAFPPTAPAIANKIEHWREEGRIPKERFTAREMHSANDWVVERIGTRTAEKQEINANNNILYSGAKAHGLVPRMIDLNTFRATAAPDGVLNKKSALTQLLLPLLQDKTKPLPMLTDAVVDKLLWSSPFAKRSVSGVQLSVRTPAKIASVIADPFSLNLSSETNYTVAAKYVVVSAGPVGSAELLLKSGVKNRHIGKGIVCHPVFPLFGEFDRTIDNTSGAPSSVFVDSYLARDGFLLETRSGLPQFLAIFLPQPPDALYDIMRAYRRIGGFSIVFIDSPDESNRIALNLKGNPVIHYRLPEIDRPRFAKAINEGAAILFKGGAKKVYLGIHDAVFPEGRQYLSTPAEAAELAGKLTFAPYSMTMSSGHLQSSLRMGKSWDTSVVDGATNKVWGTDNLYVVDSSVFPGSVGANPMQTIYAMAKIVSDDLIRTLPKSTRQTQAP